MVTGRWSLVTVGEEENEHRDSDVAAQVQQHGVCATLGCQLSILL